MPKGTKVDKCFQKVKKKKGASSAAAICQKSTGQSLKTGKSTKKKAKPKRNSRATTNRKTRK